MAFRGIGCGHSAMQEWCSMMNMPNCLSKLAFQNMQDKGLQGSQSTFQEVSKKSVEAIKEAYGKIGVVSDKEGVCGIGVSYDGMWQKGGHSSHKGVER